MKKKIFAVLMILALAAGVLCGCSAEAEEAGNTLLSTALVAVVDVIAAVLRLAILAGGTWLAQKLVSYLKLKTVSLALETLTKEAVETVKELQQTLVEDLKAKNGGKLTESDITRLHHELLNITLKKLSDPCRKVLEAAAVDIIAKITSIGEAEVKKMHDKPASQALTQ